MPDFTCYVIQCKGDGPPEVVYAAGTVTECDRKAREVEKQLGQGTGWVKVVDDRKGKVVDLNGNGIHLTTVIAEKKAAALAEIQANEELRRRTAEAALRARESQARAAAADAEAALKRLAKAEKEVAAAASKIGTPEPPAKPKKKTAAVK